MFLGVLVALGCSLFVLEAQLPPMGLPGLKLGLANLITLLALHWYGPREAGMCLLCRILLCSLFAGQAVYLFYSATGGLVCYLVLLLFRRAPLWARSALAAIGHHVGQLTVAALLTDNISVFGLLLYLVIGGIICGSIIGVAAELLVRRLKEM